MKFTKKGNSDLSNNVMKVVFGFLGIVIMLLLVSALLPEVMNVSAGVGAIADLPLAGLFTGGVVVMIIVVSLIVSVIKHAGGITKK